MRKLYIALIILILSVVYFNAADPCVNDTTAPAIWCPSSIVTVTDPGSCTAVVGASTLSYPIFFDACGATLSASGIPSGYAFPVGVTTVTWSATDAAGNSSSCTQTVTVTDEEAPTINCPANIIAYTTSGQCNATVNIPLATASDNCSITSITNDYNVGGANASDTYPLGVTTVTYTATDSANNMVSCSFDVTVINSQSPVITLVGANSITLEACTSYTEYGATASDTCLGDISSSIVIDNSAVDLSNPGIYNVTYNVLGASQVTRTVNVVDTTSPTLTLIGPDPLTIGDCATYTELGATAIDCGQDISGNVVVDNSSVNPGALGTYTVYYNVTDASGNAATQITRQVTVTDVNIPEITLIGDVIQSVDACTVYTELGATATDPCSGDDISASIVINDTALDTSTVGTYNITYNVTDASGNDAIEVIRAIEVVDTTIIADAGSDVANTLCTDTTITLAGNTITADGTTGLWSVTSGQIFGFSFSDPTSPTATFIGDVGEVYELTWSINNPCGISSDTMTVTFMGCNALDFDGIDDNISFRNNYNFTGDFSIELWIKSDALNANTQTILSKREAYNQTDGYDLRVVNNYISFNWNNGQTIVSPYQITTGIWHHIAVTFSNNTYKLYIDGIQVNSETGSMPISNAYGFIIGGMYQNTNPPHKPINYFKGGMDELRIWKTALTQTQIRTMMNQEIEEDATNVKGTVIPLTISGLTWNDLYGYYRMEQSTDLFGGNLLSSLSSTPINGRLRYITTLQPETAPLPYISDNDGDWYNPATWLYNNSQYLPNSIGIDGTTPIDWNIVRTSHNVSSGNNNITVLGLDITNNSLTIENTNPLDGQSLRITDYLNIDGVIDLVGESQLLQDTGSVVDVNSTGFLERDQQGTSNLYNYNYWGSPVSTNGNDFTIGSVLHDGTQPVNWTTSVDANPSTSPVTISSRWLYLYENFPINSYADWQSIDENSTVQVGLGFLMKGSGAATTDQNYTFMGIPNNGTITSPITAGYEALVGNPYPSAIDAHEFIYDNSSSILGTLYFWEHYTTNNSHITAEYQGGFAAYNLTGGNAAVSPPEISGLGTPSKVPERYISVGQGFNVNANATGGNVVFENDQRIFVKEAVTGAADNGSVFMRQNSSKKQETVQSETEEDLIKRVRINFKSPEGAIRHLLLGFVPNNQASDGYDYGYDALNTDSFPNDMSWLIEGDRYIIQGVGDFNENKIFPLDVFLSTEGTIDIALAGLENFESEIDVFVYDALLGTYFKINNFNTYNILLEAQDYADRFFITFNTESALSVTHQELEQILVNYLNDSQEIYIKIPLNVELNQVELYNILGQKIYSWKINANPEDNVFRIPVKYISDGNYIIKIKTTSGTLNKKVIVKQP